MRYVALTLYFLGALNILILGKHEVAKTPIGSLITGMVLWPTLPVIAIIFGWEVGVEK